MTKHPERIVVGYDGSPDADAAALGRADGSSPWRAFVVTVVVDRMESPRRPNWPESWWEEIEGQARVTLAGSRRHGCHGRAPLARSSHVGRSSSDASMLVLGSRGHGRIGEALLGSVSQDCSPARAVPPGCRPEGT